MQVDTFYGQAYSSNEGRVMEFTRVQYSPVSSEVEPSSSQIIIINSVF